MSVCWRALRRWSAAMRWDVLGKGGSHARGLCMDARRRIRGENGMVFIPCCFAERGRGGGVVVTCGRGRR